jgi:hypothetical protein
MKKYSGKLLAFALMIAFIAVSCSKDKLTDQLRENETTEMMSVAEVVSMVNEQYLQPIESDADENTPFNTENDGLIDIYTATAEDFDSRSIDNKLLRCLASVGLDSDQATQTRRALNAHEQRNEHIIQRHRNAYRQLNARMNNARQELVAQFQNGEIDRMEFHRRMNLLRERYQQGIQRIRSSNAEAFSRSFNGLMLNLQDILNARQWAAFTGCMRS